MKTLIVLLLLTPALSIAKIYNGTLVDAHSQVGPLISNEQVSKQIINNDVDLTLLSIRGKWDSATQRYLSIQKLTNQKTKYLIPTKLGGFTRKETDDSKVIRKIKYLRDQALNSNINYVGFGEIIVQHAPHNHSKLKYEGINLDFKSERINKAIDIVLSDKKPVILHVELNDYEEDSKKILSHLIDLAKKNPSEDFLLMHMAQIEFSEAEYLLNNTNNIHFITSHADNETKRQMKRNPGKGQMGWINLFDKNDNLQKRWLDLMNKNPKRFVLALDNVWDGHWLKGYSTRIYIWRKALSSLDKQAALLIACGNANDYFKLEIKCLEER